MALYELSTEAQNDLFEIWTHIAADSVDLANRIYEEFHALFGSLGQMPGQGHTREDLTGRPVLFFPLYSYLIVLSTRCEADSRYGHIAGKTRREASFEGTPMNECRP